MQKGQKVEWISSYKKKQGEIIEVVDPNNLPLTVFYNKGLHKNGFSFNSYGGGMERDHKSYLVALHEDKKVRVRKLFWPRVSLLKPIENYK